METKTNPGYQAMKQLFLTIFIVILFCTSAFAAKTSLSDLDGADWQGWDEGKKINFLSGFLLGSSYVIKQNEPTMSTDDGSQRFDDMRKRLAAGAVEKKKKRGKATVSTTATFGKEDVILWGHYRASMIQKGLADYAVYDIKIGQLSQGMDEFYKDPKNTKIRISDAVYVVKKQIRGASPEDLERVLQYLRGEP
jgi:hypothetical protein